jgi:hypothetical protein
MDGGTAVTFWLKRPGQDSWDAEPVGEPVDGESPSSTWAGEGEWALSLPHSCDAWVIGYGSREEVLADARKFRKELDKAIRRLEQAEAAS